PTAAPPWNPEAAPSDPWEAAVRLPGRVISIPLAALGTVARRGLLAVESASLVPRVQAMLARVPEFGVAVLPASLGDRTGFGATARLDPPPLRRLLVADLSGSTGGYNGTRVELRAGPARLGYPPAWRPANPLL